MKRLSLLLFACAFILSACEVLWPRDNPADPGAQNYSGYDTVTNPEEIAAVSPAPGGTLIGTTLSVTKVIGATAYELRIASSAATLESAPLFSKADFPSNVMDISGSGIQHKTSYWWKARAVVAGKAGAWSAVYSLSTDFAPAATPTFSPAGGDYKIDQSLTLSSATTGAAIYYTTDGTDPTTDSTLYSDPIDVLGLGTKTIKAIATKACIKASATGTATYLISYVST
ncbi:MAG: chitobiase/beta-hexosaminidase C-terminal domain-containing protein, partial [Spirochaetota bacterium]